jgi:hypothetical protein
VAGRLGAAIDELKAGQTLMAEMHARELAVAQHDAQAGQQAAAELRQAEAERWARGLVARLRAVWRGPRGSRQQRPGFGGAPHPVADDVGVKGCAASNRQDQRPDGNEQGRHGTERRGGENRCRRLTTCGGLCGAPCGAGSCSAPPLDASEGVMVGAVRNHLAMAPF